MKQFADFAGIPSGHKQGGRAWHAGSCLGQSLRTEGSDAKKKRRAVLSYCDFDELDA